MLYAPEIASFEVESSLDLKRRAEAAKYQQISPIVGEIIASASAKAYFEHTGKTLENQMRAMVSELYSGQADPALPLAAAADLYARGYTYRITTANQISLFNPRLSVNSGPIHRSTPYAFNQMMARGNEILDDPEHSKSFATWYRGLEDLALLQVDSNNHL